MSEFKLPEEIEIYKDELMNDYDTVEENIKDYLVRNYEYGVEDFTYEEYPDIIKVYSIKWNMEDLEESGEAPLNEEEIKRTSTKKPATQFIYADEEVRELIKDFNKIFRQLGMNYHYNPKDPSALSSCYKALGAISDQIKDNSKKVEEQIKSAVEDAIDKLTKNTDGDLKTAIIDAIKDGASKSGKSEEQINKESSEHAEKIINDNKEEIKDNTGLEEEDINEAADKANEPIPTIKKGAENKPASDGEGADIKLNKTATNDADKHADYKTYDNIAKWYDDLKDDVKTIFAATKKWISRNTGWDASGKVNLGVCDDSVVLYINKINSDADILNKLKGNIASEACLRAIKEVYPKNNFDNSDRVAIETKNYNLMYTEEFLTIKAQNLGKFLLEVQAWAHNPEKLKRKLTSDKDIIADVLGTAIDYNKFNEFYEEVLLKDGKLRDPEEIEDLIRVKLAKRDSELDSEKDEEEQSINRNFNRNRGDEKLSVDDYADMYDRYKNNSILKDIQGMNKKEADKFQKFLKQFIEKQK